MKQQIQDYITIYKDLRKEAVDSRKWEDAIFYNGLLEALSYTLYVSDKVDNLLVHVKSNHGAYLKKQDNSFEGEDLDDCNLDKRLLLQMRYVGITEGYRILKDMIEERG